jgi:hypothetical protein
VLGAGNANTTIFAAALRWFEAASYPEHAMSDSLRDSKRLVIFPEWRKRFSNEIEKNGRAHNALNRVARSEAQRAVVLELLFHEVMGNYWLGAGDRDWKGFKNRMNSLLKRAQNLAFEFQRFSHLMIFNVPLLEPAAFLAREGHDFPWRQTVDSLSDFWLSSAAKKLESQFRSVSDYVVDPFVTAGDKIWNVRVFGNLNLLLLMIYVKRITGHWHDKAIASLVGIAYEAAGKHWKPEKSPVKSITQLRRRFRTPESQFKQLHATLHPTPAAPHTFKKPPAFLKRYRDRASMERDLSRMFLKRHRFHELSTMVQDFVAQMEAGHTKDIKDSLLGYMNQCMIFQLRDLLAMRSHSS